MRKTAWIYVFIFNIIVSTSFSQKLSKDGYFTIPSQKVDFYNMIQEPGKSKIYTTADFTISSFVTLREYKEYLRDIKKDSSSVFYKKQLPQIEDFSPETIEHYLLDEQYELDPVVGITWLSAMHFCKWKTMKENKDSITFIYRLPSSLEWLAAFSYLETQKIKHDLNKKYSDWLINQCYSIPTYYEELHYLYIYKAHKDLHFSSLLTCQKVIGNSYIVRSGNYLHPFSYLGIQGYRHVSFRMIKEDLIKSPSANFEEHKENVSYRNSTFSREATIAELCLDYWE